MVTSSHSSSLGGAATASLLSTLPNPELAQHFLQRLKQEQPDAAEQISADANALRYALTIFSYSRFLSEAVLRHPEWILELARLQNLHIGFSAEEYEGMILRSTSAVTPADLAVFRRRQILRIVLRDVLRFADLPEVTRELSAVADAIVNAAWRSIHGLKESPSFTVIALGKLGGNELNYSSDIDLMFLYFGEDGSDFKSVAKHLTELLSSYTADGLGYRVDLRLRPDGRYGEICHSIESAKRYYASRARDWELQMLIKARVCAGDKRLGLEFLDYVEPLIYRTTTDFRAVEAVSATRARIHEKLDRRRDSGLDVKLTRGGIRDIEFLVQCLQRLHGGREAWVRHGGTLLALSRLRDKELLSLGEYARLASAYQFLRELEHRLQFDEDRQTHTLPSDEGSLEILSRKMPSADGRLEAELKYHLEGVQELYERVIHSQSAEGPDFDGEGKLRFEFPSTNLARYLERRAPELARLLGDSNLGRAQMSLESFLEKVVARPDQLSLLNTNGDLARCTLDLFEHSRFFADELVRSPNLLFEVAEACSERQGRNGFYPPLDPVALRCFFREQMIRIQADSVYHRVPVFKTLKRTSDLAEAVISAAYNIALGETTPPDRHMMVIALGRLGMREFDLASDADLIFVLPDSEASQMVYWTAVAERIIHVIGAYTGEGVMFSIDTRLRPNGREGALVQTESTYKDYFQRCAEAWEGIAFMKARAVAGDVEGATNFLNSLQEVDWRRYGQSGRSRAELAAMRARLEKELGTRNPLKAGPGGYYDIDFSLMYLRLKGAGIFFKVLNTPERIDVVEKMGHLDRDDATFLREAATFFRALDHGLRVSTGHAESCLPVNRTDEKVLFALMQRWAPDSLKGRTLDRAFHEIRVRTRDFYQSIFGRL